MLFNFLKYLQPTHYFQLYRNDGTSVFPKVEQMSEPIKSHLNPDPGFKSDHARQYDLSWQAIHKGYIGDAPTYTAFDPVPIADEYRFLWKYFHPAWVFYVLLLRLATLKNPFREIGAYTKSRQTKRRESVNHPLQYLEWESFQSPLLQEMPKVSIIIPTLNRYPYLKDVLADLEKQDYKNFEVIIVDQSQPFQKDFYAAFQLDIRLRYQEMRALWLARNSAIEMSTGEFLLFFDDDSRVEANWISNHLKCLDFFKGDISAGVSISTIGAEVPANYSFFHLSSQLDTGNVMIKKQVFREIGLFDRQFEKQRMGDGEFGLRAYQNGFLNISNPYAQRLHLKVGSGGLREMGSWDAFRSKNIFAPRPLPSVLYLFRKYFGRERTILAIFKTLPQSTIPYRYKKDKKLLLLGILISILAFPIIMALVCISWYRASKKLKEGGIVEDFEL